MNLFLLIDMSRSNSFGLKKDLIAEVGATLALANKTMTGLELFFY